MTIMCDADVTRALGALEESRTNSTFREKRVFPGVVGEHQDLERACRNNIVKAPHLRGLKGAEFRTGKGHDRGHGPRGPPGSSQVWAQGTEWKGGLKTGGQCLPLPHSGWTALPLVSREMKGAAPALFPACQLPVLVALFCVQSKPGWGWTDGGEARSGTGKPGSCTLAAGSAACPHPDDGDEPRGDGIQHCHCTALSVFTGSGGQARTQAKAWIQILTLPLSSW